MAIGFSGIRRIMVGDHAVDLTVSKDDARNQDSGKRTTTV